jgi:glycerol-3-phosphate dehydrogenase
MKINELPNGFDLVVVGGGVTGSGVFREATRAGLSVLLVEQNDFAWGTSSRSSKMVHGGLRYLKEGRFLLTRTAVKERERLLREAPGLVEPLEILVPIYDDQSPSKRALELGLSIYGLMAMEKQHSYLNEQLLRSLVPDIKTDNLQGGFRFWDAQVDDARLVLRLINEGCSEGGCALNYTKLVKLHRDEDNKITGVTVTDTETSETRRIKTGAVVNATGSWAERLHPSPKANLHLRALRGSHLIFSTQTIPVSHTVSFVHPEDQRPIFVSPWEGGILLGTTDMDHAEGLENDPVISKEEVKYLLDGVNLFLPRLNIGSDDCISTLSGVRPVLSEGKLPPSKESRDNVIWTEDGLVTVTGGKLTTFRKMAMDTLKAARPFLPPLPDPFKESDPIFLEIDDELPTGTEVPRAVWRRLCGRYGQAARDLALNAKTEDLSYIPGTKTVWAELPHTAANENIRHLSDLLLRRVRIGLLTPNGGKACMDRIKTLCEPVLPWDAHRWEEEIAAYFKLYNQAYSIPED